VAQIWEALAKWLGLTVAQIDINGVQYLVMVNHYDVALEGIRNSRSPTIHYPASRIVVPSAVPDTPVFCKLLSLLGFTAVHFIQPKNFWFVQGSSQAALSTLFESNTVVPPSGQVIKFTCSPRETAPDEVEKKFLSWFGIRTICIQAGIARSACPAAGALPRQPRPVGGIVWLTVAPETFAASIEACDPLFWSTTVSEPCLPDILRVVHNGNVVEFAWNAPGPMMFDLIARHTQQ
jgi:hypothetical protein